MYTLTILHDDGATTTDRLRRVNESSLTGLDRYEYAVREWESQQVDENRAVFLINSGTVVRRWENTNGQTTSQGEAN